MSTFLSPLSIEEMSVESQATYRNVRHKILSALSWTIHPVRSPQVLLQQHQTCYPLQNLTLHKKLLRRLSIKLGGLHMRAAEGNKCSCMFQVGSKPWKQPPISPSSPKEISSVFVSMIKDRDSLTDNCMSWQSQDGEEIVRSRQDVLTYESTPSLKWFFKFQK